jgi:hypothetical protein
MTDWLGCERCHSADAAPGRLSTRGG